MTFLESCVNLLSGGIRSFRLKEVEKITSEKLLKDSGGKPIGYELSGTVIDRHDTGLTIEIRPRRSKSVAVDIGYFDNVLRERPHAPWIIGAEVRVLILASKDHTLVPNNPF